MMKTIEKIAIGLVIAGALQGPALWGLLHYMPNLIAGDHLSVIENAIGLGSAIAKSLASLACAAWLYYEAKRHEQSRWIWCLLGLLFRLPAIAVFYGFAILEKLNTHFKCEPRVGATGDLQTARQSAQP